MPSGRIEKLHAVKLVALDDSPDAPDKHGSDRYGTFETVTSVDASAPGKPFRGMPACITSANIPAILRSLGLGGGIKVAASGTPFSVGDVDAALTKHGVNVQDRIRFKSALSRYKLLRS